MPTVNGIEADRHKYVIDGVIDDEVVQRQSRKQLEQGETSVLHYHKHNEQCEGHGHGYFGIEVPQG